MPPLLPRNLSRRFRRVLLPPFERDSKGDSLHLRTLRPKSERPGQGQIAQSKWSLGLALVVLVVGTAGLSWD